MAVLAGRAAGVLLRQRRGGCERNQKGNNGTVKIDHLF
jgi:hypothetical protein